MPKYVNSAGLTKALSLVKTELAKKAGTSAATQSAAGLMSAADKKKLDGITAGANAYTHPTTSGNKHIPSGGSSGKILRWSADGTAVWGDDKDTTYSAMTGATSSAAGKAGLVPAPAAGKQAQYLRGDGTWATPTDTKYNAATTGAAGLMSAADKTKLDGIAAGANAYTHPTTSGNKHIPSGGSSGQILRWSADGTAVWGADNNTTYNPMTGATASAAGSAGLVPAPAAGKQASFLRGDGTWVVPTDTKYSAATQSAQGLMSADDKKKLDGIATGATKVTVDSGLSSTSTNPVQNKVINSALAGKASTAAATQSAAGLMSAADKKKLDGVAEGANAYTHPTSSGNKHIPAGGSSGQILRWSADGTAVWGADNNTTYNAATQSAQGLMSAADKKKLDGIATGANAYSHPSTHPVSMITGIGVATTDEIDAAIAAL